MTARTSLSPCFTARTTPHTENVRSPANAQNKVERVALDVFACVYSYLNVQESAAARGTSKQFSEGFRHWTRATQVLDFGPLGWVERPAVLPGLEIFFSRNSFPRLRELRLNLKTYRDPLNFLRAGSDDQQARQLVEPHFDRLVDLIGARNPLITRLSICSDHGRTTKILKVLGKNLETLNLKGINDRPAVGLTKQCPRLREFSVRNWGFDLERLGSFMFIPQLRELGVHSSGQLDFIIRHCKQPESQLTKVTISLGCSISSVEGANIKKLLACEKLQEVRLQLTRGCLSQVKNIDQLLEALKDTRLSVSLFSRLDESRYPMIIWGDPAEVFTESPWDKQEFANALLQIKLKATEQFVVRHYQT